MLKLILTLGYDKAQCSTDCLLICACVFVLNYCLWANSMSTEHHLYTLSGLKSRDRGLAVLVPALSWFLAVCGKQVLCDREDALADPWIGRYCPSSFGGRGRGGWNAFWLLLFDVFHATFSTLHVIWTTFLTLRSWNFLSLGRRSSCKALATSCSEDVLHAMLLQLHVSWNTLFVVLGSSHFMYPGRRSWCYTFAISCNLEDVLHATLLQGGGSSGMMMIMMMMMMMMMCSDGALHWRPSVVARCSLAKKPIIRAISCHWSNHG